MTNAPETESPEVRTRTQRFDLRALYETSRLLSASLDLGFVLESLLLTAMSKLFVLRGAALLYEPVEDTYRVAAAKGSTGFEVDDRVLLAPLPGEDILRGADVPAALAERGLTQLFPIVHGSRKIGWLALGEKATGQSFTASEMEFMQSLVNMSAAAIHNALLVEELQQANRDLDAKIQALNTLFDLSQEFNATVDRDRLVKLLTFALMGQLAVRKHLFLLRRTGGGEEEAPPFQVVTARGMGTPALEPEDVSALCGTSELVRLEEAPPEPAVFGVLRARGFALVLPIRHQGETCAVLCLGPKLTGGPYTPGDVEFLYALGNLAFVSIQNAYLVEEQIEKERLEEEVRLARGIQERLQPRTLPEVPGAALAARNTPSRQVGGDYFDLIPLAGGRLLLSIADVTGKGVPAALLMANLQACLHALHPIDMTLEEATAHVNRVVCENTDFDKFITFFHGIYHPEARRLDYVNAGHNPPLVIRAGGGVETLTTGGLLLGVMREASYERGQVTLAPGDVLTLFTDGVTEAMNADGEEYGEDRLTACLQAHRAEPAQALLDAVHADVRRFAGHLAFFSDDLTMVVLKVF